MMTAIAMEPEDDDPDDHADLSLPDVGHDLAPTNEMIVQGNVGNGQRDAFTPELTKRIQVERKEMQVELKRSRREAYEEGIKDALSEVAKLQTGIIEQGNVILQRLQDGTITHEELSSTELGTLKLANTAAKEAADRAVGKAKTTSEVTTTGAILHLLTGQVPNGE